MMDRSLDEGESQTLEFKKTLAEMREIVETVCAFANTKGGRVFVGVDDSGNVLGVELGKRSVEEIALEIARNTDPKIFPEVAIQELGGKKVIVIKVSERADKPVFAFGMAYKRVGKANLKMDREEILESLKEIHGLRYEDTPICSLDDLELGKVQEFARRAKEVRKSALSEDPGVILQNLGMANGKVSVAGALCFGKDPQKFLPWATIKIGKFVGGRVAFEKEIRGDLTDQIERAFVETLDLTKRGMEVKGAKRTEEFEYPPRALREILVNAVCHREYSSPSPIYVRVYDDRLEVENPGGLAELGVEDLKKPHRSVLRNPRIGEVLYYLGYIEKWGVGTLMVWEECMKNGNGEPTFESNGSFKVILRSKFFPFEEGTEEEIVKRLRRKPMTRMELEKLLGIRESTARKYLGILQAKGIVRKIGKGKKVKYVLSF
jgi:ATP-dependent DNA helicase RecG